MKNSKKLDMVSVNAEAIKLFCTEVMVAAAATAATVTATATAPSIEKRELKTSLIIHNVCYTPMELFNIAANTIRLYAL